MSVSPNDVPEAPLKLSQVFDVGDEVSLLVSIDGSVPAFAKLLNAAEVRNLLQPDQLANARSISIAPGATGFPVVGCWKKLPQLLLYSYCSPQLSSVELLFFKQRQ